MQASVRILCTGMGIAGLLIGSRLPPPHANHPEKPVQQGGESLRNPNALAFFDVPNPAPYPTPVPEERLSEWSSLAELNSMIRRPNTSPADYRLRLMEAINSLSPQRLEQMITKELQSDLFLSSNRFDFQYAASRLGEIAPEKAADLWANREEARGFSGALIASWARRDPSAFANWTLLQSPEVQRASRESLTQTASSDPAFLPSIAHQLASSPNASQAARAAMRSLVEKEPGSEPSQLDYASKLPEGSMRTAALCELALASPNLDLGAHPEVLDALASLSERDAYKFGSKLANKVDALPQSPVREAAMSAAMRERANADPIAAAKRLESIPVNSPDYAAAVRGFVDATSTRDPASAAEWALSIPPVASTHRSAALERVATEYFRAAPAAASDWVEKAPLTNEEYRRLTGRERTAPKP